MVRNRYLGGDPKGSAGGASGSLILNMLCVSGAKLPGHDIM